MNYVNILGVHLSAVNLAEAANEIERWLGNDRRTYVTVANVHTVMEAQFDKGLRRINNLAGMCVPDGMPTVWLGRVHGHKNMGRVYGPDLMLELLARSPERGTTHFFYGGKEGVAEELRDRMVARFPGLKVVGTYSPPFRRMTGEEETAFQEMIEPAAPDILWVGLGAPKQERWMAEHVGKLNAKVMIGVGAAFDFHTGRLRQAPHWMQRMGLEWFFRLCVEPQRLWRRYLLLNPLFIWLAAGQLLGIRRYE